MRAEREEWFLARIGKVLYRNNYCPCEVCKSVYDHGIFINDKEQAIYCYDHEVEFTSDGSPLRYFDTREEMLEFEKILTKKDQS